MMPLEALEAHIKRVIAIEDHQLKAIAERLTSHHFSKKAHLLHVDERVKEVHFIIEGCVWTMNTPAIAATPSWWVLSLRIFIHIPTTVCTSDFPKPMQS